MHFEARIATNPIEANIHHTLRGEKTPDSIHTHTRQAITPHKTSQHATPTTTHPPCSSPSSLSSPSSQASPSSTGTTRTSQHCTFQSSAQPSRSPACRYSTISTQSHGLTCSAWLVWPYTPPSGLFTANTTESLLARACGRGAIAGRGGESGRERVLWWGRRNGRLCEVRVQGGLPLCSSLGSCRHCDAGIC